MSLTLFSATPSPTPIASPPTSTSSILSQNSSTPLSSKSKTRLALSLLKSEQNPHKILEIYHAASLTPKSHLDRIAFSIAISKLSESNHFDTIHQFLDDLLTSRPDLKMERFASHAIVLYGQAKMIPQAIDTFIHTHTQNNSKPEAHQNPILNPKSKSHSNNHSEP